MTKPAKSNQMVPFLERDSCTTKVRSKRFQYLQYNYENIFLLSLQTVKKKNPTQTNCAALFCSSKQRTVKIAVGWYEKKTVQKKKKKKLQALQKTRLKWKKKEKKQPYTLYSPCIYFLCPAG